MTYNLYKIKAQKIFEIKYHDRFFIKTMNFKSLKLKYFVIFQDSLFEKKDYLN